MHTWQYSNLFSHQSIKFTKLRPWSSESLLYASLSGFLDWTNEPHTFKFLLLCQVFGHDRGSICIILEYPENSSHAIKFAFQQIFCSIWSNSSLHLGKLYLSSGLHPYPSCSDVKKKLLHSTFILPVKANYNYASKIF